MHDFIEHAHGVRLENPDYFIQGNFNFSAAFGFCNQTVPSYLLIQLAQLRLILFIFNFQLGLFSGYPLFCLCIPEIFQLQLLLLKP